jgi:hypothetical protein
MAKVRALAVAITVTIVIGVAGCGGDDDGVPSAGGVPAAGENTPPSGTPGVPEGATYDLDGAAWIKLSRDEQNAAAADYIADNEDICQDSDPEEVADYVSASVGGDFPLYVPAADVLSEGCAAAVQS